MPWGFLNLSRIWFEWILLNILALLIIDLNFLFTAFLFMIGMMTSMPNFQIHSDSYMYLMTLAKFILLPHVVWDCWNAPSIKSIRTGDLSFTGPKIISKYFLNSLIIHVYTKKIVTLKEVWIPGLDLHNDLNK